MVIIYAVQGSLCGACICPGRVITYNCVAPGGLATVWQGTAFNCTGNRISLLHSDQSGHSPSCNGGAIRGQLTSFNPDNNSYSSELDVAARVGLHNKTVECFYSNGTDLIRINGYVIEIQSGKSIPLLNNKIAFSSNYYRTSSTTKQHNHC